MFDRDQIIARNKIPDILIARGYKLLENGRAMKCPWHEDNSASVSIFDDGKGWKCHACDFGGSVIDLVMRLDKVDAKTAMATLGGSNSVNGSANHKEIWATYRYVDELGKDLYEVVRYMPKDFRQRRKENGEYVWDMKGVRRVLYRLPSVLKAEQVVIAEGEKDADSLAKLGYCGTCNVGGAGKWLDGYNEALAGKEVILCGDNDDAGRKHVATVLEALAGIVKSTQVVEIPSPSKDVSDFIKTFEDVKAAKDAFAILVDTAPKLFRGLDIPIRSMAEAELGYIASIEKSKTTTLNLANWLPSLGKTVRNILPGEMICIIGDTGTGKTALLQNLARAATPITTLLFEMELPESLTYERFIASESGEKASDVYNAYETGLHCGRRYLPALSHIWLCNVPGLSPEEIERWIMKSELKIGSKPALVLVDYAQLLGSKGTNRYERASTSAEALRIVAKRTNTIVILASQIARKREDEGPAIKLHEGKDSGSLENSSSLVLGVWRSTEDDSLLFLKVLKNTKGRAGQIIECNFDGPSVQITERTTKISDDDIPSLAMDEPESRQRQFHND